VRLSSRKAKWAATPAGAGRRDEAGKETRPSTEIGPEELKKYRKGF
jgi:hypothetical protein